MLRKYGFLRLVLLLPVLGFAQNGKIISKQPYCIPADVQKQLKARYPELSARLRNVNFYRLTYLSDGLKNSCQFKAAVVIAGMANAHNLIAARPDMETAVFAELIPNYEKNKKQELEKRSAVFWADKLGKTGYRRALR